MVQQSDLIRQAVATGYRANPHNGMILNRIGQPMSIQRRGDRNPTFRARFGKTHHEISVSKFIAYVAWGDIALTPFTRVLHLNGNLSDNRLANLQLQAIDQHADERALRSDPAVQGAAATLLTNVRNAIAAIPQPIRDAALWQLAEVIGASHIPLAEALKATDLDRLSDDQGVPA